MKHGRKIIVGITVVFAASVFWLASARVAEASVIRKPPINLGLVGYWSFDVGKGGLTAVDQSGSGNTGTLTNMDAGSDWVDGKLGQALDFDGSNDHITIPDGSNFKPSGSVSISAWVKTTANTAGDADIILGRGGSGGDDGYSLEVRGNKASFYSQNGGPFATGDVQSDADVNDGIWHHLVGVYDTSNNMIYLDGSLASTTAVGFTTILHDASATPTIGKRPDQLSLYFNGLIDEVRIYNRALSANEVARLYRLQKPKILTPNNTGLVGYWSFNEGAGGYAGDMSGNGNTGTLTNMDAGSDWVDGKLGQALDFDGSNDYVLVSSQLGQPTNVSLCSWVKLNAKDTTGAEVMSFTDRLALRMDDTTGPTGFYYHGTGWNNTAAGTANNIAGTGWRHVCFTHDDASDSQNLYIDGVLKKSTSYTQSIVWSGSTLNIGRHPSSGNFDFNGSIDEVRIYNRALSAAEVAGLYSTGLAKINTSPRGQLTNGLVGYWTFDGPDLSFVTNLATDVSGNGNHGRLTNMSTTSAPVIGRLGQALDFDGVNDQVVIPDSSPLDVNTMTLSAWVKPTTPANSNYVMIAKWQSVASSKSYFFILHPSTRTVNVSLTTNCSTQTNFTSNSTIPLDTWTHVAATYDGSQVVFWVNGVADGQTSFSGTICSAGSHVSIGHNPDSGAGSSQFLNGSIDEVRIYNRALSAAEIKRLYNMGR